PRPGRPVALGLGARDHAGRRGGALHAARHALPAARLAARSAGLPARRRRLQRRSLRPRPGAAGAGAPAAPARRAPALGPRAEPGRAAGPGLRPPGTAGAAVGADRRRFRRARRRADDAHRLGAAAGAGAHRADPHRPRRRGTGAAVRPRAAPGQGGGGRGAAPAGCGCRAMIRTALLHLLLLLALAPAAVRADSFEFHPPASADDPGVPALIRDLAERMLPVYQDADTERYLANLSALQMADSNYAAADDARQSLRERQQKSGKAADQRQPPGRAVALDLYVHARTLAAAGAAPLDQAFAQAFREAAPRLGDREAYAAGAWLTEPPEAGRDALQVAFDRSRAAGVLDQDQALELVWTWLALDARRSVGAAAAKLVEEDGRRRYAGGDEVVLRGAGGGEIHIRVLLPRAGAERRAALLQYALDPPLDDARACAARGYAGVLAYSRLRGGHGAPRPFLHEGEDVRAVIRWIARQPWSDGRVGLYGDGYGGFAAWAAAKQAPAALKAIAAADPMAPGIDFPAPGRIFRNDAYAWALAAQSADGGSGRDAAAWQALDRKWYRSGAPYRDYDRMAGAHNHAFQEWLAHPSYDRWWQKLIPYGKQFARIDVPVLS